MPEEARFCMACGQRAPAELARAPGAETGGVGGRDGAGRPMSDRGGSPENSRASEATVTRGTASGTPGGDGPSYGAPSAGGTPLPPPPVHWTARSPLQLRSCPACGFRGEGIPYFRRAGNMALLAAATIFTYAVGGVIYWLLKRRDRVCPSCGLGWERSRPLGEGLLFEVGPPPQGGVAPEGALVPRVRQGRDPASAGEAAGHAAVHTAGLPSGGGLRRVGGVLLGLLGLFLVGLGLVELEAAAILTGGLVGLAGALSFGSGWKALRQRRQDLLQRMQRQVIQIARRQGGSLTATQVAAEMDLSLAAAERILLSLDDGFRVTSEVTDEGILLFDFREIRLGPSTGGRSAPESSRPASGS